MRKIAMCVAIAMSGCSMSMMKTVGGWDGKAEPVCTDTAALAFGDVLLATLGLGLLLAAVDTKDGVDPDVGVAVAGGSSGLLFAISALYGNNAADDCKAAKAGWKVHEATK